ncbi:fimbrial protein [Serratia rubidaea]|uniref:Fimbria A protein n=1 Tax=Serratia rubidaea TaxID=61652 RepID=A0A3S4WL64_SERRU|nr:fimbrial protein [Serratia rubidaea]MBH1929651.1 type 1 fimbrial protein [Serratia rubidaea]MDC6118404.1 fimbrial protein [Serratia rubidaea]MEB7585204.1 type 1 fimbrial protein [Serratia rubidaea]VEI68352.1 Fimbria A protein precursor [Serratia rubidaea]
MRTVFYRQGFALLLCLLMPCAALQAKENLYFHGSLVAEPCLLEPKDAEIELDFGNVVDKYLYLNQRTVGEPFAIRLTQCDTKLGNLADITLKGSESGELPGLLQLAGGSLAKGVAIGLESTEGKPLPINKVYRHQLHDGSNTFNLMGYVQAEPTALKGHTITLGSFSAALTLMIDYP